jgi:hypothetical protein
MAIDRLGIPPDAQLIAPTPMIIPRQEEVVYISSVVACKSGMVYVSHPPQTQHVALQVLLQGVKNLSDYIIKVLLSNTQKDIVVAPAGAIPPLPKDIRPL